ncbi:MAG: LacI family DNA-binding transcriptional regulator [Lachnospiraceae bacterium]|nr:LacI family DNA-binding transcriptional regulator [Lachnospiraceae bacterium]
MSITAKDLARLLNLSAAAVSMALHGKPGVSTQTRKMVIEAAERYGYDFTKITPQKRNSSRHIVFIIYKRHGSVVGETPFFSELSEGITTACEEEQYKLQVAYVHKDEEVKKQVEDIVYSDCAGIVLLGTEMQMEDLQPFLDLPIPLVLLDAYFDEVPCDCVLINNSQGAAMATNYLINRTKKQPGYLKSSYGISNFEERAYGFYKAVRHHGLSTSNSIVHEVAPSIEGAFSDMMEVIARGEKLASCYFADNDWIAIGAIRAFKKQGICVPKDIAVIGFDNVPMASYIEPSLTTVHVPKKYMGEMAVKRLIDVIGSGNQESVKIEILTKLKKRQSL